MTLARYLVVNDCEELIWSCWICRLWVGCLVELKLLEEFLWFILWITVDPYVTGLLLVWIDGNIYRTPIWSSSSEHWLVFSDISIWGRKRFQALSNIFFYFNFSFGSSSSELALVFGFGYCFSLFDAFLIGGCSLKPFGVLGLNTVMICYTWSTELESNYLRSIF